MAEGTWIRRAQDASEEVGLLSVKVYYPVHHLEVYVGAGKKEAKIACVNRTTRGHAVGDV
jgi:hypothetical protein